MFAGRQAPMDVIEECGESSHGQLDESSHDEDEIKQKNNMQKKIHEEHKKPLEVKPPKRRPAPLEILEKVKINNTKETPRSTIKSVLGVPHQTEIKFSRENLRKVEDQLKRAFVEFYQKLRLLKNYW